MAPTVPKTFAVPFALRQDGRLLDPSDSTSGVAYRCPACFAEVRSRAGTPKPRRHFYHRPSPMCSPETVIHATAKRLIVEAVKGWVEGKPSPTIVRRCQGRNCREIKRQALPPGVTDAEAERVLSSGRVVDVALLAGDTVRAAVEVRVTHEVDEQKVATLGVLPWIELEGAAILDDPMEWTPLRDHFRPFLCATCADAAAEEAERVEAQRLACERAKAKRVGSAELLAAAVARLPFQASDSPVFTVPPWSPAAAEPSASCSIGAAGHGAIRPRHRNLDRRRSSSATYGRRRRCMDAGRTARNGAHARCG